MAAFPTLSRPPNQNYSEDILKPIIKSSFEGNYAQTRPRFSRSVKIFNLMFKSILVTDRATLQVFFAQYAGDTITWLNPTDSVTYNVRFGDDSLTFKHTGAGYYEVSVKLEEV